MIKRRIDGVGKYASMASEKTARRLERHGQRRLRMQKQQDDLHSKMIYKKITR